MLADILGPSCGEMFVPWSKEMINLGKTVVLRTVFPVALSIFAVIWTPSARVISNDIFLVIMMMITAVVFSAMVIFTAVVFSAVVIFMAVVFSFNRWSSFKCIVHMLSVVERWTPSVRI